MNGMGSDCSSGCESGWTMYLDQPSFSPNPCKKGGGFVDENGFYCEEYKVKEDEEEEEEEEDLSMVSDASSGPPHFHEDEDFSDENGCFCSASSATTLLSKRSKKQKIKPQQHHHQNQNHHQDSSLLDDTASSPLFNFSNNNFTSNNQQTSRESALDFSQGFSATNFKGRSSFQKHFGFLKSSKPRQPTSAKQMVCREKGGNELW